jgi:hypothetical protein
MPFEHGRFLIVVWQFYDYFTGLHRVATDEYSTQLACGRIGNGGSLLFEMGVDWRPNKPGEDDWPHGQRNHQRAEPETHELYGAALNGFTPRAAPFFRRSTNATNTTGAALINAQSSPAAATTRIADEAGITHGPCARINMPSIVSASQIAGLRTMGYGRWVPELPLRPSHHGKSATR